MATAPKDRNTDAALNDDVRHIRDELERLNAHPLLRAYANTPRMLYFMFLKGVAFGLGSVVGATIVVSVLVYLLSQIEFVPIVGEWVRALLDVIQQP